MKTHVIGDVHGAGQELLGLLDKLSPGSEDRIILVGDVFDRGKHADVVWDLINRYKMEVMMGNHEFKMMYYLQGRRNYLPPHYHYAMNLLIDHGVSPQELLSWLEKRPLIQSYGDYVVVHAGIDPLDYLSVNESWNIFGRPSKDSTVASLAKGEYFWDRWQGQPIIIYGHLVSEDNLPRIRKSGGLVNSVGLDTGVVHGQSITAITVEDFKFTSYRSFIDWAGMLKVEIRASPVVLNPVIVNFVLANKLEKFSTQGETDIVVL